MSKRLTVHHNSEPIYDIVIDNSYIALGKELEKLNISNRKLCIVTESTVGPLYSDDIKNILLPLSAEVKVFTFEAGEKNKNLDVVRKLYEFLILNRFERKDMLVALGGGVVGDLTGFTAATYLRGIDFVQIPTSLLSQVDSSVGGKTGVDFDDYKNMVGAFYQPKLVFSNISTLKTLTRRQYLSGMGEVIKAGLIKDSEFYNWLKANKESIKKYDEDALEHLVYISCDIKRSVVESDFKEKGERALLNFGHTLGHAIEKIMNFTMLHGECVALGMIAASYISKQKGYISEDNYEDIVQTIKEYELLALEDEFEIEKVIEASKSDKKMNSGIVSFVVLETIGNAKINRQVTDSLMSESLDILKGLL
ncbi:MAG: 3-dehydroquinate synthase [Lachnospiraceae bacterium]|nr:3-dehydroquinate synthase [Lachnospiraceae bacterium]